MTIKELKEALAQFDENMEVNVYDNYGYWGDCNNITIATTEDYEIDKDLIILESR